jgi:disulfide bond formation protein DsbB
MTETPEQTPVDGEDENPLDSMGNWSFFVIGLLFGFLAAAGIGIVVLMALDPLGPSERVAVESTSTTAASAAPGGGEVAAGDSAGGEAIYGSTCVACHGPDAAGIPGLGLPLVDSEFVQSMSDAELIAFIETGRPASDGTTGVAMPPKGGNPSLTDQDIADVVAFLRTLQ